MEALYFSTASELAAAIRQRRISAVEVLEAHLEQIARQNPALNAIVVLDEEGAHRRAYAADKALAKGELWGPLHDVPYTLKDVHDTAGLRSTMGSPQLVDRVAVDDNTVATRIKAAGGVLLGKTNARLFPDNPFGRTNNPWDLERSPGESSSGSVAAIAAGMTPIDIGSDIGGSITVPSHYTGVFGLRPTERRVPVGKFATDPFSVWRYALVVGPMARSAADLRLGMRIIAGPDPHDMDAIPLQWREVSRPALHDLRIAWASHFTNTPIDEDIQIAIEKLASELDQLGAQVEQILPPVDLVEQCEWNIQFFKVTVGSFVSPHSSLGDYFEVLDRREAFIYQWEKFLNEWDLFLCPAYHRTAQHHDQEEEGSSDSVRVELLSAVTGQPAVTVPLAKDKKGLPIGVQLMGRRWEDERLLEIAELIAEVTGGFQRPPGY